MQSSFRDETRISFVYADELDCLADACEPGPSSPIGQSSPPLSSRTSSSSATVCGHQDPDYSHEDAFYRDQRRWSDSCESSDTLTGTFIASHFHSLKNKFPSILGTSGYQKLATDELRPVSRRIAHRKKTVCVLILAAILLGIGGSHLRRASSSSSARCRSDDSFCSSLHDEDSLQDASIQLPTVKRPEHPTRPEDILLFDLHHPDSVTVAPLAPSPSASNRRQLTTIPSQQHLFDKDECIEAWVAGGEACKERDGFFRTRPDLANVDLLYTWVNGSDLRHSSAKWMHGYRPEGRWQEYVEEDIFPSSPSSSSTASTSPSRRSLREAKRDDSSRLTRRSNAAIQSRFRDHQELRFSMRSAAKHLHGLSTIHIVAPDFSAPYHLQPGARQSNDSKQERSVLSRLGSRLRRRSSHTPFRLEVDRLNEAYLGLPSQLRRVQGLGTDRFTTDEGQIREGQLPQWLSIAQDSEAIAGQDAAAADPPSSPDSFSESLSRLFSSPLSTSSSKAPPKVRLHHDWNAFTDNWLVTDALTDKERKHRDDYRRAALPTFNSMAVEAMLGDQPGLHDTFIYSNDDFFITDDVSTGDISSPFYGPVLRLDYNLVVAGKHSPEATPGEWSALWHTNWLLDQRFGARKRPYIQHVHKSFSRTLLLEARMGWAHEHAKLALNRFRNGGDNIVSHFLAYYNTIERHREALLWSFFMLKLDDDGDGLVGPTRELEHAMTQMGLTPAQAATAFATHDKRSLNVIVRLPKRTTLKDDSANTALIRTGWPVPLKSRYAFTSHDGYPLSAISPQVITRRRNEPKMERRYVQHADAQGDRGKNSYYGWPDFVDDPSLHPNNEWHNRRFERPACELDLDRCLVLPFAQLKKGMVTWEQVFKQFAYVDGACGDCLIHHLVGQSGERGLSAFLPPADRTYTGKTDANAHHSAQVPHLPLTPVWNATSLTIDPAFIAEPACFSVSCVLTKSGFGHVSSLRTFASKLIQRYAYTIGESPLQFKQLETQYSAGSTMRALEQTMKRASALERFEASAKNETAEAGAWLESQRKVDSTRPAFVCINDDLTDRWSEIVGNEFTRWMGRMWPLKQRWEL